MGLVWTHQAKIDIANAIDKVFEEHQSKNAIALNSGKEHNESHATEGAPRQRTLAGGNGQTAECASQHIHQLGKDTREDQHCGPDADLRNPRCTTGRNRLDGLGMSDFMKIYVAHRNKESFQKMRHYYRNDAEKVKQLDRLIKGQEDIIENLKKGTSQDAN